MKFSENWLREHVKTAATRDELIATLTAIGLEVESVQALGQGLAGVVVGMITRAERHPDAERLQVCLVDIGQDVPLQIVCGAPNARVGLKAPLATVGTQVGELTITSATLRGVASHGMLCSALELGLDADASGLLELASDAPVGAALASYLDLPDATFELKLTPNRGDCLGIRGIAFDVAAASGSKVEAKTTAPVSATSDASLVVELHAGSAAPRYVGRVVEEVDASVSTPLWMAERLRRSGVRPVSLLVDVTQYVMLETGQPMHAFDRALLTGPIGVRHVSHSERLTLLDGRDVALEDGMLVITDADRPVALAGVMGGLDTRVTDATRSIFLEAAHFSPTAIIGRSRRLGLHTEAGQRFERGVDPELPRVAIEMATRLIVDIAGGHPGPVIETVLNHVLPGPKTISLRRERLTRVLGMQIASTEVIRILTALGFNVQPFEDGWHIRVPARRFDLAIEEDLIEEIARIHGYDRMPATLPDSAVAAPSLIGTRVDERELRRQLAARDYVEAVNYAFVDGARAALWGATQGVVMLSNPLSAELGVMRPQLLIGLVDALSRNVTRQQTRVRLFEIGSVFKAIGKGAPLETLRIAAVACGTAHAQQWGDATRAVDFYDLKGDLESLLALCGANLAFRPSTAPHGHPGRSADVVCIAIDGTERVVGWVGQLHPRMQRALDVEPDVYGFELDMAPLQERAVPRVSPPSRFPSVRRDLAVIVRDDVTWEALSSTATGAGGPVLKAVRLFDRYQGKGVEPGFKSLAMGLILQDDSRTLTDRDVDGVVSGVIAALQREHAAVLRG